MKNGSHSQSGEISRSVVKPQSTFFPLASIKCVGRITFRSQAVRDYACLLDVELEVFQWISPGPILRHGAEAHQTDFIVTNLNGETFAVTVGEKSSPPPGWVAAVASAIGYEFRFAAVEDFSAGYRLRNAKDLLRYGFYRCPLGDRVRLLAALDDLGSLTVTECMAAFQESKAMPSLAALILQGFLEIDLDSGLIGPETQVRRIRE
jgi:hypothetical protein